MAYSKEQLKKVRDICSYYRQYDENPVIVGMNDSQGVGTILSKKSFFYILSEMLKEEGLTPVVLDLFSLVLNKTEHIDYMLKYNVPLNEIKKMKVYSYVGALEKILQDHHVPGNEIMSQIGKITKFHYPILKQDEKIKLTDTLKYAKKPIVIYSSGMNDLMRTYGSNPIAIKKAYQLREKTVDYNYTIKQIENKDYLKETLFNIETNFTNLYRINPNMSLFVLGGYIPFVLLKEGMEPFQKIILEYNKELEMLCHKTQSHYVDVVQIGAQYNQGETDFHINIDGHKQLALKMIEVIAQEINGQSQLVENLNPFIYQNGTMKDVANCIYNDLVSCYYHRAKLKEEIFHSNDILEPMKIKKLDRYLDIMEEHVREIRILEQSCQKTSQK